jgi:hypothetical protein
MFTRRQINLDTGCWLWTGALSTHGYGRLKIERRVVLVHRLAAHLWLGLDLTSGDIACHNCPGGDNPACFNPAHLFVGSAKDNAQDTKAKGRLVLPDPNSSPRGQAHCNAKLTDREVVELRRLRSDGWTWQALAERFGITVGTAHMAGTGRTWKHLEGDTIAIPTPGHGRQRKPPVSRA